MSENPRRVAFVSGAARGIGKAIAIRLAKDGLDVAVNDIAANESALKETADEIISLGKFSGLMDLLLWVR